MTRLSFFGLACAFWLATTGASSQVAVQNTGLKDSWLCTNSGASALEPLGDRQGHAIRAVHYVCTGQTGLMQGGTMTASGVYEWTGNDGKLLVANGVMRKPGSVVVYATTEGSGSLVIVDGRPVGARTTGKGVYRLATGAAAELNGKTFTYSTRPIANGQFIIEGTVP
jgi:hypothetical protein